MLGIFEDEWRENVPISSNPEGTGLSKLASNEKRHASTATYFVNRS